MVASWPTSTFLQRMSIAGMVSERLSASSMSDWQLTDAAEFSAFSGCHDARAERGHAAALRNRLRFNRGARVGCSEHDFAAGIEVLALAGERNARESAGRLASGKNRHGIEVAYMAAEAARKPIRSIRPRRIPSASCSGCTCSSTSSRWSNSAGARFLPTNSSTAPACKFATLYFGGRTAFDEVQIGAIFYNDERVFELACALRIQAEVTLQREVELWCLSARTRSCRPTTRRRGALRIYGRWAE